MVDKNSGSESVWEALIGLMLAATGCLVAFLYALASMSRWVG